jgi:Ca2+-binding RTX toxin-like protein
VRRLIAIAGLACCALAACAPTALADLSLVAKDQESTGYSLVGNDASTESNDIEISPDPGTGSWVITDVAGVAEQTTECIALGPTAVRCVVTGFSIVKLELEDGADDVRGVGAYGLLGPSSDRFVDLVVALGRGRDRFVGGEADHAAIGGPGADRLVGGGELDNLVGGPGRDRLLGRGGNDALVGGGGNDTLAAGSGRKGLMLGGKGKDRCVAGRGNNRVGSCEKVRIR